MVDRARESTAAHKRDRATTRAALLAAARLRFARDGYDAASVRDIAGDVGVDPALVFRYFGSKQRLFDEASAEGEQATALADESTGDLPLQLLHSFVFKDWAESGGEHPLVAMLRSSQHEGVRARLYDQVCEGYVRRLAELVDGEGASLRAELLSALLLGIAVQRSVIRTPILREATPDDLIPLFSEVADLLLGHPPAGGPADRDD